jgi:hypothetical protein
MDDPGAPVRPAEGVHAERRVIGVGNVSVSAAAWKQGFYVRTCYACTPYSIQLVHSWPSICMQLSLLAAGITTCSSAHACWHLLLLYAVPATVAPAYPADVP